MVQQSWMPHPHPHIGRSTYPTFPRPTRGESTPMTPLRAEDGAMPYEWSQYLPTSLWGRSALIGATAANLAAPPAAALVAAVYRFPVPLSGYAYGPAGAIPAAFSSLFYLLLGGVVVLGGLGAAGGLLATRLAAPNPRKVTRLTIAIATLIALLGATALATLELFIGAW